MLVLVMVETAPVAVLVCPALTQRLSDKQAKAKVLSISAVELHDFPESLERQT
jgi:hypothetical protein